MALLSAVAVADEIELVNGKKYRGLVLERTASYVTFKAVLGSGTAKLTFPVRMIRNIKVDGKMPSPSPTKPRPQPELPGPGPTPKPPAPKPGVPPAEIDALIDEAGKTFPDWWDSVPLKYPPTLDLAGTNRAKGWAPQRNLGAHWYSVINPNRRRWKPGVKLLHKAVEVRKNNPAKLPEAMNLLARSYLKLLKDWPRAAYWYRKLLRSRRRVGGDWSVCLAECYFRLGNKSLAADVLRKYPMSVGGAVAAVKLLGEMGMMDKAISMAEALARGGRPEVGYLAAGDVCRRAGKLKQALAYYEKILARKRSRRNQRMWRCAQAAAEGIKLYQALDLSSIPDGTYAGTSTSFRGPLTVKVTISEGRIESVAVTRHRDDMPFTSLTDVPASIVKNQGLKGADTVTGATVTSEAIIHAAAKALAGGMR